jgi:Uncharacterized protein conserved in bacteria
MQYVLLIYSDEKVFATFSEDERNAAYAEYGVFTNELRASGGFVDGNPLQGTATATTVQVRDGEQVVTDGPFAETKEQLGGYYIVETDSLDEALQWAAKIPGARYGSIEVRPVLPMTVEASAG